jgi:hypothetical protein
MRRKILIGIVIFLVLIGLGYLAGPVAFVIGLGGFGAGFFIGRRQGASR